MIIFFKYISKCMMEKKGRFTLLVFSIALSTGLLISILGAVEVTIKSFEKPIREQFETKTIIIEEKDKKPFFNIDEIEEDGIRDVTGEIVLPATNEENEETITITIHGRENENIKEENIIEGNINDFKDAKCIVSKRVSEEKDLEIGDGVEAFLNGEKTTFEIQAISSNESVFYGDSKNSFQLIVPYEYIAKSFNVEGKYNYVTAVDEENDINKSIEVFNKNNDKYEAKELFNTKAIEDQMSSISSVLYIMLAIVVVMSALIIYGSFKLTITERLSTIGTFLSQGATYKTIEGILCLESIGYGVLGAVLGSVFGFGGLYLINYISSPLRDYGIVEEFTTNPVYFINGSIFAILLSLVSAIIPIMKIRKLEVKDVILNNVNVEMHIGWSKCIIGTILLGSSIIINFIDEEWVESISGILIIASIVGVMLIYPKIIDLISNILFKMLRGRSKSIVLATNNLRTSKVLMGNITLMIISMLSIFMITSIGSSLTNIVEDAYKALNYDVSIENINGIEGIDGRTNTDKIIEKLKENKEVDSTSIDYTVNALGKYGDNGVASIEGVNPKKYKDFNGYLELNTDKYKEVYEEFENADVSEKKILISKNVQKESNVTVGDDIEVEVNNIKKSFKVVGVIDGKVYNNGYCIFMNRDTLKNEFNINEASQISMKAKNNPRNLKESLKPVVKELGAVVETKDEFEERNKEGNKVMIDTLAIFSYMAIVIAALGVLNNIMIGFLQRKRELAVLSSAGMTNGNRNLMLIIESILSVVWATIIAVLYSFLGVSLLTKGMKEIGLGMDITLNINAIPLYFVAGLVIILLATVPILFKSKKLSIIEELKYE